MKPRALLVLLPCLLAACNPYMNLPFGAALGTHSFRIMNDRQVDGTWPCPGGVQATLTHGGTTETVSTPVGEMYAYTTPRPMKVGDPVQVDAACLAIDGSTLIANSGTFVLDGDYPRTMEFVPGGVTATYREGERLLSIRIPFF